MLNEIKIRSDFFAYDLNGWVCDVPGQMSGNSILNLCEKIIIYKMLGILNSDDKSEFIRLISSCEVEPGLYNRTPNSPGNQESFDDLIGLAAASYVCGFSFADDIYSYGEKTGWNFNNTAPSKWSAAAFLGRNPSFVAHIYACCRKPLPVLLQLAWAYAVGTAGRNDPTNEDAFTLTSMFVLTKPEWANNPIFTVPENKFINRLYKYWPNGMNQVQASYRNNSKHPIAVYWPGALWPA